MGIFRLSFLLQLGFVIGSNYRHVKWLEHEKDIRAQQPIYNSNLKHQQSQASRPKGATERIVLQQTIEDHLPRVVTAFLHTGDSITLKHANCSRRYELSALRGRSQNTQHHSMHSVLNTVMHATNFLNMILQTNRSREQSLRRDIEWYYALVRSILEGDSKIYRAIVTCNTESSAQGPSVFLQATRAGGEIVLQDLSRTAYHHIRNRTAETEWYHDIKDIKKPYFHKRVLSQDISSVNASLKRGHCFIPDKSHIKWSAPYLECENGNFIPRWLLTLSIGFYGLRTNLAPDFRGVVRVDVNLQDVDIDQCSADGWFAGTHRCNLTTMECLPIRGHGFVLDKYKCHCKTGFYHPNRLAVKGLKSRARKGKASDRSPNLAEGSSRNCLPCREGCAYCKDDSPCVARNDSVLRMALLSSQGLCMLGVFLSMVVIYHFRRNKSIRASGLVLLEAILIGALLLYFPVVILYFQPSVFRCILLRWVRLVGFATVYGTMTLKLYRVLKVFLSRTAQQIPYMTSWRVLHLLGIILLIVCWFLVAWTSATCQNMDRNLTIIEVGYTRNPDVLQFSMCLLDRWDYMMAVAEFLFLLWGVYLCYAVRTVPSAFHEPRYMAIAIHNELILSAIFHIIRFVLAPELHPDWMLLLWFAHTHLTLTVTLGLMIVPKFLFNGTHMRDDMASEAYEDEMDIGRSGSYLNSSITSAWSEHSLDPEDIREELKKLYSQLEIYKRKKMLANNPHLQKKRSSRKGLGRSIMKRITEIPETVHRQCSREEKEIAEHGSNRNSICILRKNPFDPSHSGKPLKEESLKSKVFSLKKSHSSYDHVHSEYSSSSVTDKMEVVDTEGSLIDTLMNKKLVKKKSNEKIDAISESTENVPLVCKSASAHNLTQDKKAIHPRTTMLQKSLSVIASAKEKTLGLTGGKSPTVEDSKKVHQKPKEAKNSPSAEVDCYPHMIGSQSVEYKQTAAKSGIIKHQPSICSDTLKAKQIQDLTEVCPWEIEDLPTPSENKVQKHVSIAPVETTTVHGIGFKGVKSQQQKQKGIDQSPTSSRLSKDTNRVDNCPWEDRGKSKLLEEGSKKAQSSTQSTQPAKTIQVNQLPVAAKNSKKNVNVCPWDFEEGPDKSSEGACSPDKTRHKKSTTPAESKGKVFLSEPLSKLQCSSLQSVTKVEVCPWDYDHPAISSNSEEICSSNQVSKAKVSPPKRKGMPFTITFQKEKQKAKNTDDEKSKDKSKSIEKATSQSKMTEACPWDVKCIQEMPVVEKLKSANFAAIKEKQLDVCPWDYEDVSEKRGTDRGNSGAKPKGASGSAGVKADVCQAGKKA